jgi:hypothetical protein
MNIDRRQLALPVLAIGLLGMVPAFAAGEEDAVAKNLEAFRAAQFAANAAIVRFHWIGESEAAADGKKSSTNLHILMNWQKQGADWKLLSRASTKL